MKVGLIDIEPNIFNTALMQISHHHKLLGDTVKWAIPLEYNQFDKLYCSSLFNFTDKSQIPARAICGGTGFDLTTKLPFDCEYDYSIYPKCKTSYVWFSRGCNRNCPFCVVRQKEGKFHLVTRKQLNPKGSYVTIVDNDFFANPNWESVLFWVDRMPVDIMGIDVRTITNEQAEWLDLLKRWKNKQFKIAWDNPKDYPQIIEGIKILTNHLKPYKIMCYVLIGYWSTPEEDLYRVETLRKLGISPFVMAYDKKDLYQKSFARWVNSKPIFKIIPWKDYFYRVTNQEKNGNGWAN